MSFDISASVGGACDHLQILERYVVDFRDFRTLHYKTNDAFNMRAPINGVSMVRLYIKGSLVKPSDPVFGYTIVPDPLRVESSYPFQKIVFNQPVRELGSLIEVTYLTHQGFCLKCGGSGKVVDWTVSPAGSLNRVTGAKKLAQQALKYILTSRNPFNPNLTSPIRGYLFHKFGVTMTDHDIATAVTNAMSTYQSIQKAQGTVQQMDPAEMIRDVQSVSATQDPNDPTVVNLSLELLAYGSTEAIPLNLALQTT